MTGRGLDTSRNATVQKSAGAATQTALLAFHFSSSFLIQSAVSITLLNIEA
jgi:hypothetical protein